MATATTLPDESQLPIPPPVDSQQELDPADEVIYEWNEDMDEELQQCLVRLATKFCDEFRYPRRMEVMQDWRGRSFWRELQHLTWDWEKDCWDMGGPAGNSQGKKRDSAVLYTTNIYQGFGKAFLAIITQSVPNLRFEPEDVEDAADIETAKAAESLRKLIQHENDPIQLMTKAAYYAWTCGRMHGWTRWEIDKRTKKPRETQSIYGSMEVKVPVIYECVSEYPYLQFSDEYHLSTRRSVVKSRKFEEGYYKKIKGGSSGNGQDTYERTARISVKQGISLLSAGGDAYGSLVTTQRTWIRPTAYLDDSIEDKYRDELETRFPDGCYLEVDNGIYTGSRNATMDDEWTVENIMEGDGSFRNGEGTCLVSVQERTNDTINTFQDTVEKCQPATHLDQKLFDVDARRRQRSTPGAVYPLDMSRLAAGDSISNHVYEEKAAEIDSSILQYAKSLSSDMPQQLTGLSPILWGADQGGDKSGKALSIQQSAAMGLIGLPFRVIKRFYAGMMEQAVRCSSRNRKEDFKAGIPDSKGEIETIAVRVGDLQGKVRCYASSDENYPETWMSKRSTYMQLMLEANTDPTLKAILSNPENQNLAKRLIGLDEMTIPDEASWRKQLVEINLLLEMPVPAPVMPPPQQMPNPLAPDVMETIQPPPIQKSSIPVDPIYDNHAAEFLTVTIWINSEKGQDAKRTNPNFENVRLHGMEHREELIKSMPPPPPPPAPGGKGPAAPPKPAGPPAPPAA